MFDTTPLADTPLMQDPATAAALRLCGQNPVILPSGLMLLYRRVAGVPVAMLPRATPPDDLPEQLCAVGLHRVPIILSPDMPCPRPAKTIRLRAPQTLLKLDLTGPEAARRASLHGKWRNQLSRAEANGLRVSDMTMKPDHPLLAFESDQSRKRHYANWPTALTAAFASVAPEQTRLFIAYDRGHPVAHMLFLRHGCRATYHIGHNSPRGRGLNAHNLLLWRASCWLARQGHTHLEMGLSDAGQPSLARFKCRAGAQPQQTGGTWLRWRPFHR